jgi:hypothetical protein
MSAGVRIIESLHMVDRVEDWSRVRSPGRAARRRRQGHRQNLVIRGGAQLEKPAKGRGQGLARSGQTSSSGSSAHIALPRSFTRGARKA